MMQHQPGEERPRAKRPMCRSARRREAMRRLHAMKLKRAMRASKVVTPNSTLSRLASDTVHMLDQRIRHWMQLGDMEHVQRLKAVRRQIISTYQAAR